MGKWKIKAVWGVIILVVVGIVILAIVFHAVNSPVGGGGGTSPENVSGSGANMAATPAPGSSTRTAVPADVSAPNEGSANVASNIAVPSVQVAAAPDSSASFREFAMKISNNAYSPNTVIVNQGDTVDLEITAIDGNYGFNQPDYGLSSVIPKGKTQKIGFQAMQSGKFTFYCAACGGPAKGPVGYIIVTAK